MKTWSPDTCGCTVEEIYSGTSIVGMGVVVKKCAAHAAVPDAQLYGVLLTNPDGENRRKNRVEKELIENTALALGEQDPETGAWRWKPGLGFNWAWTGAGASRVLEVTIVGVTLTAQRKTLAQNWCDTTFGAGKVLIG